MLRTLFFTIAALAATYQFMLFAMFIVLTKQGKAIEITLLPMVAAGIAFFIAMVV